jgi:hypothetical protein
MDELKAQIEKDKNFAKNCIMNSLYNVYNEK